MLRVVNTRFVVAKTKGVETALVRKHTTASLPNHFLKKKRYQLDGNENRYASPEKKGRSILLFETVTGNENAYRRKKPFICKPKQHVLIVTLIKHT
ncbi:MAG: hypothetical protein EOO14_14565 [Chitinophagaceae bacterium]|nr:MAG: hypothetical protein EOO14_14565 [Chitinophagaceae bacterium]